MQLIKLSIIFLVICVGIWAQVPASLDPHYPDKEDQLVLFRLQARIARANAQIMQAQQMYDAAQKDGKEADGQYQHAIEVARGKLPKAPEGKVWVGREDATNAMTFTLADGPKDQKKDEKP